ncbi:MAG: pyridoxal phosphate-dependent aminotransferase [Erysipelotrichaceae bacterium]|nr:pyridoxal phosphate-dependent aminotransferase [Erysipelotrichaceae bacterium]
MINEKMKNYGNNRSVIRDLFEFGNQRKAEIGAENVFDFSLGNPNVAAPADVNATIIDLLNTKDDIYLHGYTSAQGDANCREAIVNDLNKRFSTSFRKENLYMTCGAAASLKIILSALYTEGDEVVVFTPYFPEYRVFIETTGAKCVESACDPDTLQIDFDILSEAVNEKTKAVIVNSPNNPSGVVYTEENIAKLGKLLEERSAEYGHAIYLITDEPYRELVYDGITVPFVTKYYRDTVVCYSFSKSLALPGERIGYILVPDEVTDAKDVYAAVCGAGRALGYVCAPSLMQHVLERCTGQVSDLDEYKEKRDLIYNALTNMGFTCIHPDGAFYLFVKSPIADAKEFSNKAKEFNLLIVPADSFGTPGFVRIAYCVATDMIRRSLPAFEKLAECYAEELKK